VPCNETLCENVNKRFKSKCKFLACKKVQLFTKKTLLLANVNYVFCRIKLTQKSQSKYRLTSILFINFIIYIFFDI
jgi:hypothetical protein